MHRMSSPIVSVLKYILSQDEDSRIERQFGALNGTVPEAMNRPFRHVESIVVLQCAWI